MDWVRPIKSPVIVKILRFTFLIGIASLPGLYAAGQVKFTTVVSSQDVGKSDYFQVEFVVENAKQIEDLIPPDFPGFRVAQGPIQSTGMSIVNGNMSQYKGLSFVLEPLKTGRFTIGGAVATVDGKQMRSNSVVITVHAGSSPSANSASPGGGGTPFAGTPFVPAVPDPFGPDRGEVDRDYVLRPGENVKDKIRKNLFVKVLVNKNSCYVGEPIVATYKLYTRLNSESRVTKRPSLNGFSVYDMVDPSSDAVSVEKLNGKNFTVHTIRKTQLIPLQAGNIDLDPVELENTVHFVKETGRQEPRHSGNTIRDLLDQMADENNSGPGVDENVTLDTKPLTITVKPLPMENKPAGFNGAVGNFSIEATVAGRTMSAQDEATLHVVVKGKGNLPVVAAPVVNWPAGIESFDPTAKEEVNKTVAPMSGSKSFDYVFTPRNPGHYTVPSVSFPYFDPATQTYKTAGTAPIDINVVPSARSDKQPAASAAVRTQAAQPAGIGRILGDHLEWIAAVIVLLGVSGYFWRQNLRLKKKSATAAAKAGTGVKPERPSAASSESRDRSANMPVIPQASYLPSTVVADPLQEARRLLDNGDSTGFYREVNRALWKAMSKKLDLPASELNKHNTLRQLEVRGWDSTSLLTLGNALNECEMNLYTPDYDRWNMQQLLRQAEWVLDRLA
ncbi:MAG TPA: BatD family protein [Puia sp.]|nr:BatD family protein [Puia sp.]